MKIDWEGIGGRRFVMTIGCGVVTSVLLWFGKLTSDAYTTITVATIAAYITGNVAQKSIESRDAAEAGSSGVAG